MRRDTANKSGSLGAIEHTRRRVDSLINTGWLLCQEGQYRKAEPVLRRALRLSETKLPGDDRLHSASLNALAVLYKYLNRFAEAGRLYRRARANLERSPAAEPDDWATIYHNLGGLDHERGRFARGEIFARRAVMIREKTLGQNHPVVAADVAALAAILERLGKDTEAERLYRRALRIFNRSFGPDHYEMAVSFHNLAALRFKQGKTTEAERRYRQALTIKEKSLGRQHPDVAITLNNLAMLYKAAGKIKQAKRASRRALTILQKVFEPGHPKLKIAKENYARLTRSF